MTDVTVPPGARPARPVAAIPALLLLAVAVWEIAATRCDATSVPGDAAWSEAAQVVRGGYHAGDLIVFAPSWVDPVGRLHLGDMIPIAMAARMDAARFGRIWEVSIRGARAPETAGLEPVVSEDHGGVRVRRYERPAVEVVSDLRDRLPGAHVEGGSASRELAEVGFAPHDCVQLVPGAGVPARITFPQLPLGTQLVGYVGIADVFTRRENRAPAALQVELAGTVIASATAGVDDGWVRFAATTPPGAADVTFVISSASDGRKVCFAAEARR